MSMSEWECLHDCTCEFHADVIVRGTPEEFHCDLPAGHATASRHWDPALGEFQDPGK